MRGTAIGNRQFSAGKMAHRGRYGSVHVFRRSAADVAGDSLSAYGATIVGVLATPVGADRGHRDLVRIVRPERRRAELPSPRGTQRRRPHAVATARLNQPPAHRNRVARRDRERRRRLSL